MPVRLVWCASLTCRGRMGEPPCRAWRFSRLAPHQHPQELLTWLGDHRRATPRLLVPQTPVGPGPRCAVTEGRPKQGRVWEGWPRPPHSSLKCHPGCCTLGLRSSPEGLGHRCWPVRVRPSRVTPSRGHRHTGGPAETDPRPRPQRWPRQVSTLEAAGS